MSILNGGGRSRWLGKTGAHLERRAAQKYDCHRPRFSGSSNLTCGGWHFPSPLCDVCSCSYSGQYITSVWIIHKLTLLSNQSAQLDRTRAAVRQNMNSNVYHQYTSSTFRINPRDIRHHIPIGSQHYVTHDVRWMIKDPAALFAHKCFWKATLRDSNVICELLRREKHSNQKWAGIYSPPSCQLMK